MVVWRKLKILFHKIFKGIDEVLTEILIYRIYRKCIEKVFYDISDELRTVFQEEVKSVSPNFKSDLILKDKSVLAIELRKVLKRAEFYLEMYNWIPKIFSAIVSFFVALLFIGFMYDITGYRGSSISIKDIAPYVFMFSSTILGILGMFWLFLGFPEIRTYLRIKKYTSGEKFITS